MQRIVYPLFALLIIAISSGGCGSSDAVLPPPPRDDAGSSASIQQGIHDQAGWAIGIDPLTREDVRDLPRWLDDEVLIVLHDHISPDTLYPMAKELGLSLKREIRLGWGTVYRMHIDNGKPVEDIVAELSTYPEIRYAEPNLIVYPCAAPYYPDDPLFENPADSDDDPWTTMYDQWGPNVLGASLVWPHGKGNPDVVIAVLDTGVRYTHEDLTNQVWINEDEIPGNGIDDDDNGYVDDWHGWDTDDDDNDPMDSWGHGTACSGVVAAEQDNGVGCTGIAPGVKVMALKCDLSYHGEGYISSVIEGVQYAYDNGAIAVSMSFRTYTESEIMHNTFIDTYDDGNGLLPCGAAGNENSPNDCWPADWPEVMEIGATCSFYKTGNLRDVRRLDSADFGWGSNWGENLEIMAPGALYITTHVGADNSYYDGVNHGTFGGTSNATPCVAGCIGLLKSFYPDMTAGELRQRLKESADDIHTPGHDDQTGWGRVNIWRAIFGSDPNEDIYDANGHIPIEDKDEWQFDNIFDISTSADYDFEDIFVLETDVTGKMTVELHIITTGQDLDMELYATPELDIPIATAYGSNDEDDPGEAIEYAIIPGQKFYVRVFSPEPYNCSNFRVRYTVKEFTWWVEGESLAPEYIFSGSHAVPVLKVEIHTNVQVTANKMRLYKMGTIPMVFVNGLRLFEDTNDSGEWENTGDNLVSILKLKGFNLNQIVFEGLNGTSYLASPLTYFVIADIGPNELHHDVTFGLGLHSYKDVEILEDAPLYDDNFPILSDLTLLAQDHEPPAWNSTVGIQDTLAIYESVVVYWNGATDLLSEPVSYNVYYDTNDPPGIGTANLVEGIGCENGDEYECFAAIPMLENGQTYFFLVRAEDTLGNEDDNLAWMEATPDATFHPEGPKVVGKVHTGGNAKAVWVHEKIAYIANGSAGMAIVDCTQPTVPVLEGTLPGKYCEGIQYHEGQGYVYASYQDGLMIIDPGDPYEPELVCFYETYWDAMDLFLEDDICYVGIWGGDLLILDISDPTEPEYLGEADIGEFQSFKGIASRDGYVYCSTPTGGLRIVDATDPEHAQMIKQLDLGNYTNEIQLWDDYAIITSWLNHRLFIVDISDPVNAFSAAVLNFPTGFSTGIAVRDDQYIYVGNSAKMIEVVEWDDLDNLEILGNCPTEGPNGLFFDGIFLYAAENEDGLKIIY